MSTFLLWRNESASPARVGAALLNYYSPLFKDPLQLTARSIGQSSLVVLDQPIPDWKRPFFEEDDQTWVRAIDYPVDCSDSLPELCRRIARNPEKVTAEMAPPWLLIWGDKMCGNKSAGEITVQLDGLGQAQLFEYTDGHTWALTNRITTLLSLGLTLEPVAEEWGVFCALGGWFPLDMTGYKRVRRVKPGTRFILADSIVRSTHDVLQDWLHASPRPGQEWKEIARQSLLRHLEAVIPFWNNPDVGLSGGWDSRGVVASLRALKVPFLPRVKGPPDSSDVICATALAKAAGLPLKVETRTESVSDSLDDWRESIELAIRWQAGDMDVEKHKTRFARGARFNAPRVNVMGQHGEIGRGRLYDVGLRENLWKELPDGERLEKGFTREYMGRLPPFIRPDLVPRIREILTESYREADRYGITGLARLDFFYLHEHTRRKNGASIASQTGLVITPFLNPDFLRATFALTLHERAHRLLHLHIIETNTPDWAGMPFAFHPFAFDKADAGESAIRRTAEQAAEAFFNGTSRDSRYYNAFERWKTVGSPLIAEAVSAGGFVAEVFDPAGVAVSGLSAPDELAVIHSVAQFLAVPEIVSA